MSNTNKNQMTLSDAAAMLADAMDRPAPEIEAKLSQYVNEGLTLTGAVARFKSENKFQLGAGRVEIVARFLGLEVARDVTLNKEPEQVSNAHFAVYDPTTKEFKFVASTVWTKARIADMANQFEKGVAYKFMAALVQKDGQEMMNRINKIEVLSDQKLVPELDTLEPLPISAISKAIGKNEMVRGTIGKLIKAGGVTTGFELSDMSPAPPLTIWFGGKYPKMSPEDVDIVTNKIASGLEVIVFGSIKASTNDVNMNAINITFVD